MGDNCAAITMASRWLNKKFKKHGDRAEEKVQLKKCSIFIGNKRASHFTTFYDKHIFLHDDFLPSFPTDKHTYFNGESQLSRNFQKDKISICIG